MSVPRNPAQWPASVLKSLDAIACLLMAAFMTARARAAGGGSPVLHTMAERDTAAWNLAVSERIAAVLRGRWDPVPPLERAHYAPEARFEIIQIMRLKNWNIEKTAECFGVHANTIRTWLKEMNIAGAKSRLFNPPINKICDAGRWVAHQIRALCPEREFGTRSIAMAVVRAGKKLSRSSVQRILREKKPPPPGTPGTAGVPPASAGLPKGVKPHHILNPHCINRTWHLDLTTIELFFIRFYVAAVLDGFSRRLLALKVYRDAPATRNMLALVKNCIREYGKPRFLVTDHGCQFRAEFKKALKSAYGNSISIIKGNRDRSKQFNGRVERFFKSFKLWQRLTLLVFNKKGIQRKLDSFRCWYNAERPMWLHGGRTPEEVWSAKVLPAPVSMRASGPTTAVLRVCRLHFHGDIHLPTLSIQFADSA